MQKVLFLFILLAGIADAAETVIFRCAQEDGTTAFQETPCAEPASEDANTDDAEPIDVDGVAEEEYVELVNPFDDPAGESLPSPTELRVPTSRERAECEKNARDAIDAIDAELQIKDGQKGNRESLAELLQLTRQLRACKQL